MPKKTIQQKKIELSACSKCEQIEHRIKSKTSRMGRIYFWLSVIFGIMAAFLVWSTQDNPDGMMFQELLPVIIAVMLSILFAVLSFIRFINNRSITGGLFLTIMISTAVFLGTSQLIGSMIPVAAGGFEDVGHMEGHGALVGLAQIGLFALWFFLLLLVVYMKVRPIRKIDYVLSQICDGKEVRKVRLGKSRQYRILAEKLELLANEHNTSIAQEKQKRELAAKRREAAKKRADERKLKQLQIDAKFK